MTHHETLLAIRNDAAFAGEAVGALLDTIKGTPHAVSSAAGQAEEARRRITANVALLAEKPDMVSPLLDVARRMRWLCSELHGRNAFSKADLWRWQEDANSALGAAERDRLPSSAAPSVGELLQEASDTLALLAAHAQPMPPYKAERYRQTQDKLRAALAMLDGR